MHDHARRPQAGAALVTSRMLGAFRKDQATRREFLAIIARSGNSGLPNT